VTPLERVLRDRIQAEGPITLEAYMEACNGHYYATRDPFGVRGDFITAPEISQMFGEIVGAALADCWTRAGSPDDAIFAELGPGRGTLASDALRVMRSAGFSGEVHLVETSPVLREVQSAVLPDAHWHESIDGLPDKPLLVVANEFLDALPIRQHVGGIERRVIVAGGFAFDRHGETVETSPVRDEAVAAIASRAVSHGGVALFIDYGHAKSAPGDTLQAVRRHGLSPVLADPGEQDLTSHVDFESVGRAARDAGAFVTPLVSQREWLNALGIGQRAAALATANPERADELAHAVQRLIGADQMGDLFKVIAVHAPDWPPPPGLQ
jgi:SAM-dependent MidA family methyltransferase